MTDVGRTNTPSKRLIGAAILSFLTPTVGWSAEPADAPAPADLLAVIAHPDDEGYWGGLLAEYAMCRGRNVVLVCLTSGEWGNGLPHPVEEGAEPDCSYDDKDHPCFEKIPADQLIYPCYYRENEMLAACVEYGMTTPPIFARFADTNKFTRWGDVEQGFDAWGGRDKVVGFVTEQIRKYRPTIVVGLAFDGGNGNPQHKAAALAAFDATIAASDADRFADSSEKYGPWQVSKMYSQASGYEDASKSDSPVPQTGPVHTHSWTGPCRTRPGATAQLFAARGNARHESQKMEEKCDAESRFVLRLTTVGTDVVAKDDLFENVDRVIEPTPTIVPPLTATPAAGQ